MGLNFVQTFYPGGNFDLESALFTFLLTLIGISMAFAGILLHSITGLIRYKTKNAENIEKI